MDLISGEWVNEWNVTNGLQFDYQEFGRAQLEVYNTASFGWTYWTLKNDRKHWDFEWNIQNNYLQLGKSHKYSSRITHKLAQKNPHESLRLRTGLADLQFK